MNDYEKRQRKIESGLETLAEKLNMTTDMLKEQIYNSVRKNKQIEQIKDILVSSDHFFTENDLYIIWGALDDNYDDSLTEEENITKAIKFCKDSNELSDTFYDIEEVEDEYEEDCNDMDDYDE